MMNSAGRTTAMPISMIMCDGMAFCGTGEDIKPVGKITVTKMM